MRREHREAHDWLKFADRDLRAAEMAASAKPALEEICAYHCQQAAEKALKAFLIYHHQEFEYTHDLTQILPWCIKLTPGLSVLGAAAKLLSPLAIDSRYPCEVTVTQDLAAEALRQARLVLETVQRLIPPPNANAETQRD